ncbi:MAG: N-acetylneuraminate synthase family protein [Bacteriovoracaceae bacterium]|nr:N-acetylneuraminate synthase family protein [Bacteriovoracaceae bacterium]
MRKEFKIGDIVLSQTSDKVFIIAEIGNNHNGSLDRAKKMVDQAVEIGVDCVKFQMRFLDEVYRQRSLEKNGDDLSAEYTIDLLKRFELSLDEHKELKNYCDEKGILYMCTPWDYRSLEVLESLGVKAYKVASADLTNLPLLKKIVETKKPMILSTGMSKEEEVEQVCNFLNKENADFCFLHCNSTYPAPFHSINLRFMNNLEKYSSVYGYSGHERGIGVSIGAVARGAKVVERHFTLDREMEGPDHAASLEFESFKEMVESIRQLEEALGKDGQREVSQGEMINRENLAKSLVASKDLKAGHVVTLEDISVKSPGQGLSPLKMEELISKKLGRDINFEDFFFQTDLDEGAIENRSYSFNRPWGIPVRYHDFDFFSQRTNATLYEFHLSYSDMELDISKFLKGTYDCDFVMHAPELFKGSRLMDLATPDKEYRDFSIKETQRTIDITRELKQYFPTTKKPLIVANIGGFTMDGNLPERVKEEYYHRFVESMKELDTEGVELIPQTMAPFPWHFGGQRYQNLFVHAEEIAEKCEKHNLRICLDISHSKLTCNYLKKSFEEFVEIVAPYTAHLHLGDAKGLDGEGLQVGDGDINFEKISEILNRLSPESSFIPEIWQGHKNQGEGCWLALERLEPYF